MLYIFLYDKFKNLDLLKNNINIIKSIDGYIKINHRNINNLKLLGKIVEVDKNIEDLKKILIKLDSSYSHKKLINIESYSMLLKKKYDCYIFI